MNTITVPRLEQLDFFSGFCLVPKSVPKPKLHRALTPREKDVLKQVRALNDPLIIEAINLFNARVHDVIGGYTAEEEARLGRSAHNQVGRSKNYLPAEVFLQPLT
jgi:hypothetical protein